MNKNRIQVKPTDCLLIIDPQLDFCKGGALAVAGGDDIMDDINFLSLLFRTKGAITVISQDWHVDAHKSFAKAHEGAEAFSQVQMPYGDQRLWPDHCIQGSKGAEFHPKIAGAVVRAEMIVRKGTNPEVDSYSAFLENDKVTKTGLAGYLRDKGIERIFIVGLARDFCCGFSALDGVAEGFEVVMVNDLTRAIAMPNGRGGDTNTDMTNRMIDAFVQFANNDDFYPEKKAA